MAPSLKLTYFNIKARAEPIRLALTIAGIPFEDERIERDSWPALKPTTPFGQLPVLTIVDGGKTTQLAQSDAILRYVGRLGKLYPDDPLEAARVDQLLGSQHDVGMQLSPTIREPSEPKKLEMRKALIAPDSTFTLILKSIDRIVAANGNPGYAVGKSSTIVDLVIYNFSMWLKSGMLDGIPTTYMDQFTHIAEIIKKVGGNEKVQAWNKAH
ncbi:hypothetical protein HK104_000088 [Borealophlyctis nickersoniae]|nr:hypothetical protein HK104_000088 [Borealophlyctis nickersoniae]